MKNLKIMLAASSAVLGLAVAPAHAAIVINFDTIETFATVDSYYNGGTDSAGEVGPNYGVIFEPGDWATTTGFGQTSQPNLAYSVNSTGYVDFVNGITTGLNFSYGAFSDTTLSIYSGLDGSGTLLGTFLLPTNNPSDFDFVALPFAGTAQSVLISGGAAQFGWDDITFGSLTPGVPEPATWAMMVLGFGLVGGAMRRRASMAVSYS